MYGKNPQGHRRSALKQHAALDPKQHSNITWSWRRHLLGQSIQTSPLATDRAACAASLAQQTSISTVWQPQHWQMTPQQLALLSQGVSLPPWLTTFLPNKCKTMTSTFSSWQRWSLYTFQVVIVLWFGDNLCNKTDNAFSGRSCLPGNIREIVFPALE